MRIQLFRVAVAAIACLSGPIQPKLALADEFDSAAPRASSDDAELIIVTATRGKRDLATLPLSASVISAEELDVAPDYALDGVLRNVPGVFVSTTSSTITHPTAQSASMRGLGGSRALVLLDGVPVNDGFGGWINWSKIPIRNIERVEIVRGAGASLWGNYAMGGVINVITRAPDERVFSLRGTGGSFNTGTADAYASEVFGDTGVSLRYRFFDTAGYKVLVKEERGTVDAEASSRSNYLDLRVDHDFSDETAANLTLTLFDEDRNVGTPLADNSQQSLDAAFRFRHDDEKLGNFRLSVFGAAQQFDNNNSKQSGDRCCEELALTQDIPTRSIGTYLEWSRSFDPWRTLVTAGMDFRHIQGKNSEEILPTLPDHGTRSTSGKQQTLGWYVEAEMHPLEDLEVLGSVRLDYWRNFDGEQSSQRGLATDGVTKFATKSQVEVSPRLSLRYAITDELALRGGVYRAFRAPNLNELYRGFFAGNTPFEPNPELDAELLKIGGELGFDWNVGPALLHVTGYWNELENFIDFARPEGGPFRFQRQNLTEVRARGFEVELPIQLTDTLLFSPSYVFADSTIQKYAPQPERVGNQIRNVPRDTFLFTARYDDPEWFLLEFLGRYVGKSYGNDSNSQKLDAHFVLDLSLSRKIGDHLEVFFMGQNITDEEYVARRTGSNAYIGVPQQFWGGLRYAW